MPLEVTAFALSGILLCVVIGMLLIALSNLTGATPPRVPHSRQRIPHS